MTPPPNQPPQPSAEMLLGMMNALILEGRQLNQNIVVLTQGLRVLAKEIIDLRKDLAESGEAESMSTSSELGQAVINALGASFEPKKPRKNK